MKTIRLFVVLSFALFISSTLSAYPNDNPLGPNEDLRKEVVKLIQNPELSKNGIQKAEVVISFTVKENGKIELLKVSANNEYIEDFVKERLEDQKVTVDGVAPKANYNLKVSFESEK